MDEEKLKAFMGWVEALTMAAKYPDDTHLSNEEIKARGLLRNHFGFHQHEDNSGPRLSPYYLGGPHGEEEEED